MSPEGYDRVLALLGAPAETQEQIDARADAVARSVGYAQGYAEMDLLVASADLTQSIVGARPMSFSDWSSLLDLPGARP